MKIGIAIHGGASSNSIFLQDNCKKIEEGLAHACEVGYKSLQEGHSALDAVQKAIQILEDNPLFNAGRGSALNSQGMVEMDASIMDGKNLKAGAVSVINTVKNPIVLARIIMDRTKHVFLSGEGALDFAQKQGLCIKPLSYFITDHQYDDYEALNSCESYEQILNKKTHGTVGAVALDCEGNLAAGTSTGGISNCLPGRVGDSCVIGAGCYANNKSCAVSGTGEGEFLITGVVAHSIAMMVEAGIPLEQACQKVLHERNKNSGEIGVISINPQGEVALCFNTEIMKRAWIGLDCQLHVKIDP